MGRCLDARKDFVRLTNETAEAKEQMAEWDRAFQFIVKGEDNFYIKFKGGKP